MQSMTLGHKLNCKWNSHEELQLFIWIVRRPVLANHKGQRRVGGVLSKSLNSAVANAALQSTKHLIRKRPVGIILPCSEYALGLNPDLTSTVMPRGNDLWKFKPPDRQFCSPLCLLECRICALDSATGLPALSIPLVINYWGQTEPCWVITCSRVFLSAALVSSLLSATTGFFTTNTPEKFKKTKQTFLQFQVDCDTYTASA